MSQTYQARRRAQDAPAEQKLHTGVPGPSLSELAAGAMPSTEQMGHRVDLPDAIREKMEASFGADFSGVKLYESQTVADAGAEAMTMGSSVAFAPGQLDLTSTSGQALLGHELSHVVSQARGESAGRGFLADSGLEAQADRQGMLAAQGESVYSGPVAPLSASAVPASAAGPMQAAKKEDIANEALGADREKQSLADQGDEQDVYDKVTEDYAKSTEGSERRLPVQMVRNLTSDVVNSYSKYIRRRLPLMNPDERQEFLDMFVRDDRAKIRDYIKNDAVTLTQSMMDSSSRMTSENFKSRADAYDGKGIHHQRPQHEFQGVGRPAEGKGVVGPFGKPAQHLKRRHAVLIAGGQPRADPQNRQGEEQPFGIAVVRLVFHRAPRPFAWAVRRSPGSGRRAAKMDSRFRFTSSSVAPPWVMVAVCRPQMPWAVTRPNVQPSRVAFRNPTLSSPQSMILQDFRRASWNETCRRALSWKWVCAMDAL